MSGGNEMNLVRDEVFAVGGAGRVAACRGKGRDDAGRWEGNKEAGLAQRGHLGGSGVT